MQTRTRGGNLRGGNQNDVVDAWRARRVTVQSQTFTKPSQPPSSSLSSLSSESAAAAAAAAAASQPTFDQLIHRPTICHDRPDPPMQCLHLCQWFTVMIMEVQIPTSTNDRPNPSLLLGYLLCRYLYQNSALMLWRETHSTMCACCNSSRTWSRDRKSYLLQ